MAEGERPKETVILVHGTWAAPVKGKHQWYQKLEGPGAENTFVAKLDEELKRLGSPARCWAHCDDGIAPFRWSGENNWLSRASAAAELSNYIRTLIDKGWVCHCIAHSHGGNILVDALTSPTCSVHEKSAHLLGKLVTLGTPFMDTASAIRSSRRAWQFMTGLAAVAAYLFALYTLIALASGRDLFRGSHRYLDYLGFVVALGILYLPVYLFWRWRNRRPLFVDLAACVPGNEDRLRVVYSDRDEAWQLLHHMSRAGNPLRPPTGLTRHIWRYWRFASSRRARVAEVLGLVGFSGAPLPVRLGLSLFYFSLIVLPLLLWIPNAAFYSQSRASDLMLNTWWYSVGTVALSLPILLTYYGGAFVSAALSPISVIWRHLIVILSLPAEVGTFMVRKRAWGVLQRMGMGLEAYPRRVPTVDLNPARLPIENVVVDKLGEAVVAHALLMRRHGLGDGIGALTDALSSSALSIADINELLRTVEKDLSLVHAAYYVYDDSIIRIAEWIAQIEQLPSPNSKPPALTKPTSRLSASPVSLSASRAE